LLVADVDAFAVCVGPGGFTGVRVGIAAVKGLASASGKPVVAVSSLEAAAFSAGPAAAVYALVKAYKGEVYAQLFSFDDLGAPVACDLPIAAGVEEALSRVSTISDLILAGSAVSEELVYGREGWRIAESHECLAEQIARLAAIKLARGETETAESLRAEYVRQSEAEIKLSKGLLGSKIRRVLGRDEIPVKE
jgi:tRNA threonylcarbamoyladenosine biosynthesis protein TsaB